MSDQDNERTEEDAERIRDRTLRRMLETPPKPHGDSKPKPDSSKEH